MEWVSEVIFSLASSWPSMLGWTAMFVVALVLLSRGKGKAERFMVAGAAVLMCRVVVGNGQLTLSRWVIEHGVSRAQASLLASAVNLLLGLISLIGIVLLIVAFWIKFNAGRQQDGQKA